MNRATCRCHGRLPGRRSRPPRNRTTARGICGRPAPATEGVCRVKAEKKASGGGSSQGGGRTGGGGNNAVSSGGGGKSGPSKLEIARKQEKAINRAVAKFQNSLKAYTSCVEGGGAGCTAPKAGGSAGERGAAPRWC